MTAPDWGAADYFLNRHLAARGWLFSERRAYIAMNGPRRVLHSLLHTVYYALPLWDRQAMRPRRGSRIPMAMWRAYRKTWPA